MSDQLPETADIEMGDAAITPSVTPLITPLVTPPVTPTVTPSVTTDTIVLPEVKDVENGGFIGQCKWFNDKLGYGFITICDGENKGKDIFVHHSGIKPQNSNYKTLKKGEYINFNIITGQNGLQAIDITGINGGPLMCDVIQGFIPQNGVPEPQFQGRIPYSSAERPPFNPQQQQNGWQTIPQKRTYARTVAPNYAQEGYVQGYPGAPPPPPPGMRHPPNSYQKRVPVKNTNKYNKETRKIPI
jgi:cold shock CspA family protein